MTPFSNHIFDDKAEHVAGWRDNDPFRLKVQKCLSAALEQISISVPPQNDVVSLRDRVHRGRQYFGDETDTPFVCILEALDSPAIEYRIQGNGTEPVPYPLLVQGFLDEVDRRNPTDVGHYLLAEVKRRFEALKQMELEGSFVFKLKTGDYSSSVSAIDWDAGTVRPSDDVSAIPYFWVRLDLTLVEDVQKPYD